AGGLVRVYKHRARGVFPGRRYRVADVPVDGELGAGVAAAVLVAGARRRRDTPGAPASAPAPPSSSSSPPAP
ncbi:hypothetical protein JS521_34110, partial [Streptomyces sp. RHZ10]|nr:hypothetical protein [Streptomyces durocortorensis]